MDNNTCEGLSPEYQSNVQYGFAIDSNTNKVVSIDSELNRDTKYLCLGCGKEMSFVRRQEEYYLDFFRHKIRNDECYKGNRYLHNLAVKLIKDRFDDWTRPFNIVKPSRSKCKLFDSCDLADDSCYTYQQDVIEDLHNTYDHCDSEKRTRLVYNGISQYYVADLLLTSSKDPDKEFLIEVWISHESSDDKKESGAEILEIKFSRNIEYGQKQIRDFCNQDIFFPFNYDPFLDDSKKKDHVVKYHNVIEEDYSDNVSNSKEVIRGKFYTTKKWEFTKIPCGIMSEQSKNDKPLAVCEFNLIPEIKKSNVFPSINDKHIYTILNYLGYNPLNKCSLCDSCKMFSEILLKCSKNGSLDSPDDYYGNRCSDFIFSEEDCQNVIKDLEFYSVEPIVHSPDFTDYNEYVAAPRIDFNVVYYQKYRLTSLMHSTNSNNDVKFSITSNTHPCKDCEWFRPNIQNRPMCALFWMTATYSLYKDCEYRIEKEQKNIHKG